MNNSISYPAGLPITARKEDIINSLKNNQVTVIAGETGSGKTTQIPKMCLEAFPDNHRLIGCTQPRRIAASTVSARVAEELGREEGFVAYKVRFHDHTTRSTRIKFMTDGVLLAETRQDPDLLKYDVIIVDEAHERSLNIDFLLGYLKNLLARRSDLKLVITSATIDTQAFAEHFNHCPVLNIEGQTYPVKIRYCPLPTEIIEERETVLEHCVAVIRDLFVKELPGDILVFLPTERDIRECCTLLEKYINSAVILPMFGRLHAADQRKIFQSFKKPKIVVATNVAETSITVPGIRYVIDSGLARISRYNVRSKTTSLPVTKISRASCNQRKGRCGRVGPGICVRLYSEEDYEARPRYTLPEIQRSNLAEVILQMIALRLGHPTDFPFIDPPHSNAVREGYRLLRELGAIDAKNRLTGTGRIMADLPIDPCISRIIIAAKEYNCLREIKIISAILAIQDPRIRPAEREQDADIAHKIFAHPHSDFISLLNIWNQFQIFREESRSWSKLRKFCKLHYLSFQRMREWLDLHDQLERILKKREGFVNNSVDASYEQVHKALLPGFLRNIACRKEKKIYKNTRERELMIFPGSHQFSRSGEWIVAASFIETNRLYALTIATIEPEWIETVAPDICKYSWSHPAYHKKSGSVMALENVSLFGLRIISGRKVNFGRRHRKNRKEARDIFINSALVRGELIGKYAFLKHNLTLVKSWEETEERLRTRNIVVDPLVLHDFYNERLPESVFDRKSLNGFLKRKKNKTFLFMREEDILLRKPGENELADYPHSVAVGNMTIRLEYNFTPAATNDGVTFRLPADFAQNVSEHFFEWLVPGLLHEKLTFLLKGLPKSIRKQLVPVNRTVDTILDDIDLYRGSFLGAVESSILKHFRLLIRRSDWPSNLPSHLKPGFLLFDEKGNTIARGKDLKKLLEEKIIRPVNSSRIPTDPQITALIKSWEEKEFTTWDFADLPKALPLYTTSGDGLGFLFPFLYFVQEKGVIKIKFERNKITAQEKNRTGMLHLYRLQFPGQYRSLKKMCTTTLSGPSVLSFFSHVKNRQEVVKVVLDFIMRSLFDNPDGEIESQTVFREKVARIQEEGFYQAGGAICNELLNLLRIRKEVMDTIHKTFPAGKGKNSFQKEKNLFFTRLLDDILPPSFMSTGTNKEIQDRKRYLQSLKIRVERFSINPAKDDAKEKQIHPHIINLQQLETRENELSGEGKKLLEEYRRMVAEFRISVFSPEIKTAMVVSEKRLRHLWREISQTC